MHERPTPDVLAGLETLERRLREFLSLLANENASPESLERGWSACQAHDGELASLPAAIEAADEHARGEFGSRVAVIRCLNAVAVLELQRQQSVITESLGQTRKARTGLGGYASRDNPGESCDVAG